MVLPLEGVETMGETYNCSECRDGEHDDIKPDAKLVVIRDPAKNRLVKRAKLCSDHIECWLDDGYQVYPQT